MPAADTACISDGRIILTLDDGRAIAVHAGVALYRASERGRIAWRLSLSPRAEPAAIMPSR